MTYNFLGLTNDALTDTNQIPLTSANFNTATANQGVYQKAKDAVNQAIREINRAEPKWPFNHTVYNETLVAGTARYDFQSNAKRVDFNSFRIQANDTFGNGTQKLRHVSYEDYLNGHVDDEYNTSTAIRDLPLIVAAGQSQNYVLNPIPDEAYTLTYEYFALPTDLAAYDDVPSIPEAFRYVILAGASVPMHKFRGDLEAAAFSRQEFEQGIKHMRSIYINQNEYMRDTRVERRTITTYVPYLEV